ncbi:MAG: hypothetical protein DMG30_26710 [Acidobacteria bacterium]|nr:MAG: hypothetical protein DMG30_26710 [Acidobacteriota bacterium]
MFAYFCRRCPCCKIGFILQLLLDPGSGLPVLPFAASADNSCPLCHTTFQPENYFVVHRSSPLGDSLGTDT